ncbi:polyhydroxyalkanoate synthesis repressor PhaR [Marinospirillum sp.]|uniref:polyhydroxyalkanoate synthesis repressor PhaR n=1 Tax=Marinospirillum sp. TaxID=2183934 RepID=UPI003A8B9DF2
MRVIRKYANRRLYDTSQSRYVTLEDIRQLIVEREDFRVEDSKTGDDLTRHILLQIITEQENRETEGASSPMFSNKVLQQLIRFYGDSMQSSMGGYLEQSVTAFMEQQKILRQQMQQAMRSNPMQATTPMEVMRKIAEQNLLLWKTFSGQNLHRPAANEGDDADPRSEN